MFPITATRIVRDEGSIVVFAGREQDFPFQNEDDRETHFAVDHRMAQPIADAIEAEGSAECWIEDWQVIGGRA